MAMDPLTTGFTYLSVTRPEYVLFRPSDRDLPVLGRLERIPRYLFRVSSPLSGGLTNNKWVFSMDVCRGLGTTDVFTRRDRQLAAKMISDHLNWNHDHAKSDNLVSWTSSLLFACQYIFYRHLWKKDSSRFDEIELCVIDTTLFEPGVFIQDVDLIDAFSDYSESLQRLRLNRTDPDVEPRDRFYFGEYLTQGSLKIENKCCLVSAQALIDNGLFFLQPSFLDVLCGRRPVWASEVTRIRMDFTPDSSHIREIWQHELSAAARIVTLFARVMRPFMLANLLSLAPRRGGDKAIIELCKQQWKDLDKIPLSSYELDMKSYNMPEVSQSKKILQDALSSLVQEEVSAEVSAAEEELLRAGRAAQAISTSMKCQMSI